METTVLKKRLNTFKSAKGKLTNVSDEVVLELLRTWEQWPGTSSELYRELGLSKMQMVILLKKGKHLVKSGAVVDSGFKEVSLAQSAGLFSNTSSQCAAIELSCTDGKLIRFQRVDELVDFLKKVA
jgi:hypothetical protein